LITVVIVNWNGKKVLSECILSLQKQENVTCSIVLVDNGSTDQSVEWVANHFPDVQLIRLSENYGFSVANNVAIREIDTPYVALLNNDAVAHPLWLAKLLEGMENDREAGLAASKMVFEHAPGIIDRAGDGYTTAGAGKLRGRGRPFSAFQTAERIFGASAGAAIYRKAMLDDIGLFDEDYFLLYEDVDLSFRAQLRGYKCLYVPEAVVYHKTTQSIGYDSPLAVYYGHRNLEWTYIQNMPGKLIYRTIFPHLLYVVLSFFFFTTKGHGRTYIKAKIDALKGFKKSMKKRGQVQSHRKVTSIYIWQLLDPEIFVSRYTRRLRRKANAGHSQQS